jgi:integrase
MARTVKLLTVKEIEQKAKVPGFHLVGPAGLYLQVKGNAVSWIDRCTVQGRTSYSGLGAYPAVSLSEAREKQTTERKQRRDGVDPVAERKAKRNEKTTERTRKTFKEIAKAYIADNESTWKNPVHRQQWPSSLETYVYPIIGDMWVDEIETDHVCRLLRPIWLTKAETAARTRGRIEKILDAAKALKLRSGENPALLASVVAVLPKREKKKKRVKHHPSLAYEQMPAFMAELRELDSTSAAALAFAILTAVRTGDIIGQKRDDRPAMQWKHVNLKEKLWTIPATKNDGEHKVPLSEAASAVLRSVEGLDPVIVFPSPDRPGEPLSNNAMLAMLDRVNDGREKAGLPRWVDPKSGRDAVPHGFRSTFRSWAGDETNFPRELAEKALAHTLGDETEQAYDRGELLAKRRKLMDAWAGYCGRVPTGNVESLDAHRKRAKA